MASINKNKPMIVYCVYRRDTDKLVYVGQTQMTLAQRRGTAFSHARKGKAGVLGAAIRKHGEDNFEYVIHTKCYCQEDTDQMEKYLIAKYKPCYNVQNGGKKGHNGRLGYRETRPEVLERISTSAKNRKRTERGPYSTERLDAHTKTMREKRGKPFMCVQNGKTYYSCREAADDLKISVSSIRAVFCKTVANNSAHGYTFVRL